MGSSPDNCQTHCKNIKHKQATSLASLLGFRLDFDTPGRRGLKLNFEMYLQHQHKKYMQPYSIAISYQRLGSRPNFAFATTFFLTSNFVTISRMLRSARASQTSPTNKVLSRLKEPRLDRQIKISSVHCSSIGLKMLIIFLQ